MAKNDNLTDFLTDIADAIRAKKGTTGLINPQDFSNEIASIESGGGGSESVGALTSNDVNFYDYDGTLLYAYTWEQACALSELPPLPTQQGLICQGWNYTIDDIKAQRGYCDVGATYITDDGTTRIYCRELHSRTTYKLYFKQTVANGVTIDWGDSTETISKAGDVNTTHTYEKGVAPIIKLKVTSGTMLIGGGYSSTGLFGDNARNVAEKVTVQRIEIGENVTSLQAYGLSYCYALQTITIPNSVTTLSNNAFQNCHQLKAMILPRGCTTAGVYVWQNCYSLKVISFPNTITTTSNQILQNNYALDRLILPDSLTSMGTYSFDNCFGLDILVFQRNLEVISRAMARGEYGLTKIVFPENLTSTDAYCFEKCRSLRYLKFPHTYTTIGDSSFRDCFNIQLYDFSDHTTIPTLGATVFTGIYTTCKIVVPDSLYDEWIAATNWSDYARYIIKKSDYDAL